MRKAYIFTEAHKQAIRKSLKNRKGHPHTKESKIHIGNIHRGKVLSDATKQKIREAHIGRKYSDEVNKKKGNSGASNPNWKGGITPIARSIRASKEYKLWRHSILERDGNKCIWCASTKVPLHVDHIKRFRDYPELRFAIDNGRVLCWDCHKTTDSYGK